MNYQLQKLSTYQPNAIFADLNDKTINNTYGVHAWTNNSDSVIPCTGSSSIIAYTPAAFKLLYKPRHYASPMCFSCPMGFLLDVYHRCRVHVKRCTTHIRTALNFFGWIPLWHLRILYGEMFILLNKTQRMRKMDLPNGNQRNNHESFLVLSNWWYT